MFGAHLSIAGGLHNALLQAGRLEMDCAQIFTKNQRQWKAKPLTRDQIQQWEEHRERVGPRGVVSHDSYLINLASFDPGKLSKSRAAFREELRRCEALDIPYLVAHPGSHLGRGEEVGLERIARSLDLIHRDLPGYQTLTALEITAGQGTNLGYRLEHLRQIIDSVREPDRLAVCIDTAHALAAGYDLGSAAGAHEFLDRIDETLGLDRVRVMHLNDSKPPRGSRVDRHAHIGCGYVALEAFAEIVHHPALRDVPKILETPKGEHSSGRSWDAVNLQTLRGL